MAAVHAGGGRRNCLSCSKISISLMLIGRRVGREKEKTSQTVNNAATNSDTMEASTPKVADEGTNDQGDPGRRTRKSKPAVRSQKKIEQAARSRMSQRSRRMTSSLNWRASGSPGVCRAIKSRIA